MGYELYHHGILGMHWGIRRYQNKDGSLTAAGKKRYSRSNLTDKDRIELKKYADHYDSELGHQIYKNLLSEAKQDTRSQVSRVFKEAVSLQETLDKQDSEFWENDKLVRKMLKEYNDSNDRKYSYEEVTSHANPASNLLDFYRKKYAPEYAKTEERIWELRDAYRNAVDDYFKDIFTTKYNSLVKDSIYRAYYKNASSLIAEISSDNYWNDIFDKRF